ncbi:MAG: stage III sporulation protein AE [Clostridia bacterium]|nr:stage III sporulation protein AE [Clostridia bacterium]
MKKRKIFYVILIFCTVFIFFWGHNVKSANADDLSDNIKDQIDNLNLQEIEDFFDDNNPDGFNFISTFKNILEGKYDGADNIFDYIKDIIFSEISYFLPSIIAIIIACLLCEIIQNIKSGHLSDSVAPIIKFVAILTVILIIFPQFISMWNKTKNIIESIGKLSEIMSPIMLTLMVASGGTVSASVYKPSVVFFTNVVINVFYAVVLPIIGILTVFNIMAHFSKDIKLKKFSDFFGGVLKWIFGIMIVFYGLIISVQGLSVANTEGISIKVAKYAISNSVPIVGGLIKDGLDIVAAGSVMVKNALGIAGLIGIFYFVLSPVLQMIVFSMLLKLAAAITDVFAGDSVSDFLGTVSKSINYFIASALTVGLMAFLTILLMVFSANTVI